MMSSQIQMSPESLRIALAREILSNSISNSQLMKLYKYLEKMMSKEIEQSYYSSSQFQNDLDASELEIQQGQCITTENSEDIHKLLFD